MLLVDDPSNQKGSGVGIILEGPRGVLVKYNNQAKYEALLAEIRLAKVRAKVLIAKSDSYKEKAQIKMFEGFTLLHVPREQNERVNLLAKLASTQKGGLNIMVIQEALGQPTIEMAKPSWRDPIINFLDQDKMPEDPQEAGKIKIEALKYTKPSRPSRKALASKIAWARFY
ncbi:hypothetical protein CR513_36070, partial [Mucuna pruriens]